MTSRSEVVAALALANRIAEAGAHFRALPSAVRLRVKGRLLLQAIIIKEYGEVQERDLERALVPALRRLLIESIRSRRLLENATWPNICLVIAETYEQEGWGQVTLARQGQGLDHNGAGCDLLLTRQGFGSVRLIDQRGVCVRGSLVGIENIGRLLDALETLPAGSKARGVVSTTADFAPGLCDHARVRPLLPARLALRNRLDLLTWLKATAATMQNAQATPDVA